MAFKPAGYEPQRLTLIVAGESGAGKTVSSLLLAQGITDVYGGRIALLDTDNRRSAMEADRVPHDVCFMEAPYNGDEFAEQIRQAHGYTVLVIDEFCEHYGAGGRLEEHEREMDLLHAKACEKAARRNEEPPDREIYAFPAWRKPSERRKRCLAAIRAFPGHVILTCEAKQMRDQKTFKLKGWKAEIDTLFTKTAHACFLLAAEADGRPTWRAADDPGGSFAKWRDELGERPTQLTRGLGAHLAKWSRGDHLRTMGENAALFIGQLAKVTTAAQKAAVDEGIRAAWASLAEHEQAEVARAGRAAEKRISEQADG